MKYLYLSIAFVGVVIAWTMYAEGHRAQPPTELEAVARALSNEEVARQDSMNRDSIGGNSPDAVLQQYILAVERHDDRNASAYFIPDRQAYEFARLASSSDASRETLVKLVREAAHASGTYSAARDAYTIRTPILIDFLRYPNGLWKLVEL